MRVSAARLITAFHYSGFQPLDGDVNDGKVISIKLRGIGGKDNIITCVYFPCITTSRDYIANASPVIAHIENILNNFADADHIIAGDFNFEFCGDNMGLDLFKGIIEDYDLICCDGKTINSDVINYTYCHETLNQHSWLDHFIVSKPLYNSLSACLIIDVGDNLSDHMPISCNITTPVYDTLPAGSVPTNRSYNLKWSKADLASYYIKSGKFLQSIVCPVSLLRCNPSCNCDSHQKIIDMYYTSIVNMLKCASSGSVPRLPFNCLKPFWSDDLDRLKTISIDMHVLWRAIGSPRRRNKRSSYYCEAGLQARD